MAAVRLGNGLGDANGLSLPFTTIPYYRKSELVVSREDRSILRKLAEKVAALSQRPSEQAKKELWYRHNALAETRPLVFCDPENGWYEIITGDQLKCKGDLARLWEFKLRKEIFWGESMQDDRVIEAVFYVQYIHELKDWGVQTTIIGGEDNGAYTWDAPLKDYSMLDSLHLRELVIDYDKTNALFALAQEILGDHLEIRHDACFWWSISTTWDLAFLRGMERMMLDMFDHPNELHRLMSFIRDDYLMRIEFLESNKLLTLNNEGNYVGSGGFGWTHELPQADYDGDKVRAIDIWGFSESQESIGISPEMFQEFILAYQMPVLEKFGLNCYGCCEPIDKRWDYVSKIPRLRRVSVSAWADIDAMAEKLSNKYIYSWKPAPFDLATPKVDKDFLRNKISDMIKRTRGCNVEIIMKDNHTIGGNPQNVIDWCKIAKEAAAAF